MAENLLEQIEQRIQRSEKVTASEVADAYTQTIENRRKEYLAKGGSYEKFETEEKSFLDGAKELRNKQLERLGVLGKEYEMKKMREIYEAREKERGVKFETALKYSRGLTDPTADEAKIDDYEGVGMYDTYGFGRQSLSGYLAAMQSMDPNAAKRDFDKAVDAFKASNKAAPDATWAWFTETFTLDEHLSDENVKKLIGHENLNRLEGYDLGMESKAFLAGYLRYSDEYYKDANVSKAYKEYVVNKLQELKENGKLAYEDPLKKQGHSTIDWKLDKDKSDAQIKAFVAVLNPKEWDEAWKERLKGIFEPFKKTCDGILVANPEFKFEDVVVKEMLNKQLADLSYLDYEKLKGAVEKARSEISAHIVKKKEEYAKEVDANKKRAEDLKVRNKALRGPGVTEEEWKALDATLAQQTTDLDAASAAAEKSSFEDLQGVWNKLVFVRDGNGLIKTQLDGFEQKTKEAEEKEPFVLKFLEEKNLIETYDASTKQYKYELGEPGLKLEGRKVVTSSNNPEVKKAFESKTIPFIYALLDKKALTVDEKKQYDAIMAKADPKDKEKWKAAMAEASAFLMSCVEKKLTSDDLLKFQKIQGLYDRAARESVLTFDHRPSLEELKKAYDEKFTPAWEKAGRDFDAEFQQTPAVTPGTGPGGAPSAVVGGGFLGGTGSETPEKTPSGPDPYSESWAKGTDVPLPEGFKGFTGGLQVSPAVESINFRDVNTHKTALAVPGGTGMTANEIFFDDPNGTAHQVDNRTFVKVKYKDKVYYAALEFLQKNEGSMKAEKEPKPAPAVKPPEQKESGELAFLGNINVEYRDALERIWKERENPDGVLFHLYFNKQVLDCSLKPSGNEWVMTWPVRGGGRERMTFKNVRDAMKSLNDGIVFRRMAWDAIRDEENFKKYKNIIDKVKTLERVEKTKHLSMYLELDWHGGGALESGNPHITIMALPHGHYSWTMDLEYSGPGGQNSRDGYAANFDDMMKQFAHVKQQAENYDEEKHTDAVAAREYLFAKIIDPRTFTEREKYLGHVVSFDIKDNEVVQMYLDWGGGAARNIQQNAALNVWIENGKIAYILNAKGKGIGKRGTVANIDALMRVVAESKSAALGD